MGLSGFGELRSGEFSGHCGSGRRGLAGAWRPRGYRGLRPSILAQNDQGGELALTEHWKREVRRCRVVDGGVQAAGRGGARGPGAGSLLRTSESPESTRR